VRIITITRFAKCSLLVVLIIALFAPSEVSAQQSSLVFTLKPGPFPVGFRSVNQYDNSRSFAQYSAEGKLVNSGSTRPIQTSIWYPAESDSKSTPILFEEYADLVANEVSFPAMTSEVRANARQGLRFFFDSPADRFNSELKARTNAVRDARPASGSFPVIVYGPSFCSQSFENSVLFEYLASFGYIIISSPCMGQKSRVMTQDILGIEAQAKDMEYLISFAHTLPDANTDKLAVMGFSWGGISNVFVQMRNDNVKAVVCLDGSIRYYPKLFKDSPYSDSMKMNVPLLYLASNFSVEKLEAMKIDMAPNFFNSLKRSDAYLFIFNSLQHQNFASNYIKLMQRNLWVESEGTQEEVNRGYETACRYVLNFLDAYLKDSQLALAFLRDRPEKNGIAPYLVVGQFKKAQQVTPSLAELRLALGQAGIVNASSVYAELKRVTPSLSLRENEISDWGYELVTMGKIKEAVEVFKLNVELYPASSGAYATLGEAYMNDGSLELAIRNLEKSVELDPQNTYNLQFLKKLREQK
jgi:tetratricopeptide (TPR) repeat protein